MTIISLLENLQEITLFHLAVSPPLTELYLSVRSCHPSVQNPQCFSIPLTEKVQVLAAAHRVLANLPGKSPAFLPVHLLGAIF